jgi:hypothetical protein
VDKFITGLKNGLIKDGLIEENHEKLGLPEAFKITIAKEGTYCTTKTLRISITFNTNHPSSKGDHSKNILMFKGRNVKYAEKVITHRKNAFTRIISVIGVIKGTLEICLSKEHCKKSNK